MAQLRNVAILVQVVVAAVLIQSTEAEDYIVGDATGWTSFPPGGDSFYAGWSLNNTFKVNDTLVFNFESGSHTVAIMTNVLHYEECNVSDNIRVYDTGPARIPLNHIGAFFFSCTFSGHCKSGQKLRVQVTASSPAQAPSPSPSNEGAPPSPTGPGAKAPPPHGSATSLAATFTLFLITTAFNFLSQF